MEDRPRNSPPLNTLRSHSVSGGSVRTRSVPHTKTLRGVPPVSGTPLIGGVRTSSPTRTVIALAEDPPELHLLPEVPREAMIGPAFPACLVFLTSRRSRMPSGAKESPAPTPSPSQSTFHLPSQTFTRKRTLLPTSSQPPPRDSALLTLSKTRAEGAAGGADPAHLSSATMCRSH